MPSGSGAASGALGGAASGAAVGSVFPGIGTAIGAGVGAIAGGLAGAFGGGGSQESGYTLPPEYELQYLQQFQQQMQQMQQDYQAIGQAYEAYNTKINALNETIQSGYRPENFRAIQESNMRIGKALGMNAEQLAKGGFITAEDRNSLAEMEKVAAGNYNQVSNPVLEGQLNEQRRQLEQDLARSGVSPQQRSIALQHFDQSANEQRYGQAQQQFGLYSNLINQRAGLRQQGYGQAANTLGLGMQQGAQYLTGYQQLGQNYAGQHAAANNMFQLNQGLRGEGREAFTTMGQFKFGDQTKGLLQAGVVGPGSMYDQTGVARNDAKNFGKYISSMQSEQFRQDNPAYNDWRKSQGGWGFGGLLNIATGGAYGAFKGIAGGNFGEALSSVGTGGVAINRNFIRT